MIKALIGRGMGDSGRIKLFKEAWELFKAHPIFGVGKGYVGTGTPTNEIGIYWFHSTFFQVIASMGIVGLMAYVYYYWARLKILFSNIKNSFNFVCICGLDRIRRLFYDKYRNVRCLSVYGACNYYDSSFRKDSNRLFRLRYAIQLFYSFGRENR